MRGYYREKDANSETTEEYIEIHPVKVSKKDQTSMAPIDVHQLLDELPGDPDISIIDSSHVRVGFKSAAEAESGLQILEGNTWVPVRDTPVNETKSGRPPRAHAPSSVKIPDEWTAWRKTTDDTIAQLNSDYTAMKKQCDAIPSMKAAITGLKKSQSELPFVKSDIETLKRNQNHIIQRLDAHDADIATLKKHKEHSNSVMTLVGIRLKMKNPDPNCPEHMELSPTSGWTESELENVIANSATSAPIDENAQPVLDDEEMTDRRISTGTEPGTAIGTPGRASTSVTDAKRKGATLHAGDQVFYMDRGTVGSAPTMVRYVLLQHTPQGKNWWAAMTQDENDQADTTLAPRILDYDNVYPDQVAYDAALAADMNSVGHRPKRERR
jgi:hypothetical protein